MTRASPDSKAWTLVDEGWGRRAVDFSTLRAEINVVGYLARTPQEEGFEA
jgi:hypothetical protein